MVVKDESDQIVEERVVAYLKGEIERIRGIERVGPGVGALVRRDLHPRRDTIVVLTITIDGKDHVRCADFHALAGAPVPNFTEYDPCPIN